MQPVRSCSCTSRKARDRRYRCTNIGSSEHKCKMGVKFGIIQGYEAQAERIWTKWSQ
jgi:hypothetical protein